MHPQQHRRTDPARPAYQQPAWTPPDGSPHPCSPPPEWALQPPPPPSPYHPPTPSSMYHPPTPSSMHRTPPAHAHAYVAYSPAPLARSSSMATHTTFKTNGVHYRPPPRRHVSEDIGASRVPASPATSFDSQSPWGYLFAPHTSPAAPTPKLLRLLTTVGTYLSALTPATEAVVTREKLVAYYATQTPHPRLDHRAAYLRAAEPRGLARLWNFLECRYYWIPGSPGAGAPGELVPALTVSGFVRWSVVQLLLCPDLEVGVLDKLLRAVELRDPESPGVAWPRGLDREAVGGVDAEAGERWGRWRSSRRCRWE